MHTTPLSRWAFWGILLALLAGAGLRLIWELDIEYKIDEAWMFERTQRAGIDEPMPVHGMPTSAEFLNPGLNVWIFVGLSKLFGVVDPPGLARIVQCLSILALVLLVFFAVRFVPPPQRELWLWAAVLMAVNPMAVIHHRKIWQPSLFPIFTTLFLMAWWQRHQRWGSFCWGLVGALLGQIQMAGFFFAAGFCLWTLLFERRLGSARRDKRPACPSGPDAEQHPAPSTGADKQPAAPPTAWRWWLAGSVVGVLPLLPWLYYMATRPGGEDVRHSNPMNLIAVKFWFHWITQPLGFSVHYVFGRDFGDFLRYPVIAGQSTYLFLVVYVLLILAVFWVLVRLIQFLWRERGRLGDVLLATLGPTHLAIGAGLWGFGLLMTLSTMTVHRHYLLVAMPLVYVWLAWIVLGHGAAADTRQAGATAPEQLPTPKRWHAGRACLLGLCILQALLSAGMLGYIHANQRFIRGDFREPYGAQKNAALEQ
jgi:hypothetical protein